jgi:hypothetical protein
VSLNREKLGLLRAIADGDVYRKADGRIARRVDQGSRLPNLPVARGKIQELQAAGLVDDELKLTDAGREADADGFPPRPIQAAPKRQVRAACGTLSGYDRHIRYRQTPCAPCREARKLHDREYRQRKRTEQPPP